MNTLNDYISEYIEYCEYRKRLDSKTLKAYRIDLKQYTDYCSDLPDCFRKDIVDKFITNLHKSYKPKSVKRKIASLKAFFHHMEYKEILAENWTYVFEKPSCSQRLFLFTPYRHSCLRSMPTRGRLNLNISIDAA